MLRVKSLTKSFWTHEKSAGLLGSFKNLIRPKRIEKFALRNVDIEVGPGEILGLVGANGAGKTTLVKCLSGIIAPTSGEVRVMGFDPWEKSTEYRRQLALVMGQKAQLWWDLPAEDSFVLLREIYQVPKVQYQEDLAYMLELLGAEGYLRQPLRRLSLGERMKMELVGALLHRPKVIFLDEPTIGLDFTAQKAIRKFLLEYRKNFRPIMILTSHYWDDIEALCKRIAILKRGEKVYDGSIEMISGNRKIESSKVLRIRFAKPLEININEFLKVLQIPEDSNSGVKNLDVFDFKTSKDYADRSIANEFQILVFEGDVVHIKVPKRQLPKMLSLLVTKFDVHDLTTEDEGIEDLIENIMNH